MPRRFASVAFWVLAGVIVFVTVCPIDLRPRTGHVMLERFAAYFLLGCAAALAWPRSLLRSLAAVGVIALALELAQRLIPTRDGHALDVLEKLAGGMSGLVFASLLLALGAHWLTQRAGADRPRLGG